MESPCKKYEDIFRYSACMSPILKDILRELAVQQAIESPDSCLINHSWLHFDYPIDNVEIVLTVHS